MAFHLEPRLFQSNSASQLKGGAKAEPHDQANLFTLVPAVVGAVELLHGTEYYILHVVNRPCQEPACAPRTSAFFLTLGLKLLSLSTVV